jgi:flavin-binding protein dodecin
MDTAVGRADADAVPRGEPAGTVLKVVEVIGTSGASVDDAIRSAVRTASATIRHIRSADLMWTRAVVGADGGVESFEATCRITFRGGTRRGPAARQRRGPTGRSRGRTLSIATRRKADGHH